MKNLLFGSFLLISICTFGQNIQVIDKNENFQKQGQVKIFEFIDEKIDLNEFDKIASLKSYSVNSGKSTLDKLFNSFWAVANEYGANSYRITEVDTKSDTTFVQIAIYCLSDDEMKSNFDSYLQNMVYVLGDLDKQKSSGKNIKVNKEKMTLLPMEYMARQNKVGEYVSVSIGGFTGAKTDIKGREGRLPQFLSLSGFGVGPSANYNTIGISISTGRIYPVDLNLGHFLIHILAEKQ